MFLSFDEDAAVLALIAALGIFCRERERDVALECSTSLQPTHRQSRRKWTFRGQDTLESKVKMMMVEAAANQMSN